MFNITMEFTHAGRDSNGNFIIDTQRFLTFLYIFTSIVTDSFM